MVEHAGTPRSRPSRRGRDPDTQSAPATAEQRHGSGRNPGGIRADPVPTGRRALDLPVTHTTRGAPRRPSPGIRNKPGAGAPGSVKHSVPVGDTGIEPVTSSVSGKRAPAAPIARADDGTRTRDPHLGKVMLYQLSHIRVTPLWGAGRKLAEVSPGGKTIPSSDLHEVSHAQGDTCERNRKALRGEGRGARRRRDAGGLSSARGGAT